VPEHFVDIASSLPKVKWVKAKQLSNWKNAIESFNEHAGHEFHLAATTQAQNFISVFENKKKDILESLDSNITPNPTPL